MADPTQTEVTTPKEREHGERGPLCQMYQADGRQGCGGHQTWCSLCLQWTNTCCQDYGTCQCS